MGLRRLAGVILDVGGTLWSERRASEADSNERAERVASMLGIDRDRARILVDQLEGQEALSAGQIASASAHAHDVFSDNAGDRNVVSLHRAMSLSALGRCELFPGAVELLATVKALGSKCALLSNTAWRDSECYWRDLSDFGISRFVDTIVTSVDTGLRKPDPGIFQMAVQAIGCDPTACVMIGNSEATDIAPTLALGMRTIRVAIEESRPSGSAAHAIAGSLHETAEILRSWVWGEDSSV